MLGRYRDKVCWGRKGERLLKVLASMSICFETACDHVLPLMYCFVLLLSTKYYDVILQTTKCSYVIRPTNELPHTKPCTYFTTYYYIRQHTIMYRYILPHEMPITKCRASRLRRFSEKPCPIQCPADLSFLDTKLWKTITFHAPATTPCHQILPFARRVTRQDRLILRQAKITKHCPRNENYP